MTITTIERVNRFITAGLACCLGILLLVACGFSPVYAAPPCAPWAGKALSVEGRVELSRAGTAGWRSVVLEDLFCPGDSIRVDRRSRAAVLLPNETLLRLDEGSTLTFSQVKKQQPFWVDLVKGIVHFISRTPRSLGVTAPYVNAAIEGTEFVVQAEPAATTILVFEGQVVASNALGTLNLASGEAATAEKGKAPTRRLVVRPRDAVQWALYYPPLIDLRTEVVAEGPDAALIRKALQEYRDKDLPAAFAALAKVPTPSRTVQFHNLRAGLLLSVGRVEEARTDIDRSLALDPNNGTAFALRSVIAVTQNENKRALQLAQKGAELSPQAPSPHIALSYAYQALFDIEQAKKSVEQAIALAAGDALAWARLAELELSLGYLDPALAAAKQAVALNPDLAHTQSVLGFAYLIRIQIPEAKAAFEKAVALNPAAPLPRLGLGLAMIRRGNLNNGTEQIEIAAILDPDNALIRSYLGKAYFEQKRIALARAEYATAKQLDPNDPTPWFYSAILKQTTNQPVAALHDLQKAMALNDNRAVYRSRLLLDRDAAGRGASLARIYQNLGFEQIAVVKATESLSLDPASSSAHRFLADTYAGQPRLEIAQVSELLQAQLLQPINVNPVQPQLVATNLNLIARTGPTQTSFNEYTPLFERNGVQLIAAGAAGNKDTWGDEVVVSGIYNRLSFSLGQFHSDTSGFRDNNDVDNDVVNVFAQAALSHNFSVQGEYRHRDSKHGDIRMDFDLDEFSRIRKKKIDEDTWRFGAHFSPSPSTDLIASLIRSDRKSKQRVPLFLTDAIQLQEKVESDGLDAQAQFQFRTGAFKNLVGGGAYDVDFERESLASIPSLNLTFPQPQQKFDVDQYNLYGYTNISMPSDVILTLGLGYDKYDDEVYDTDRVSYKTGLRWNFNDRLTLRAASFQTLKRVLLVDQTLEPTQVAGFNQLYDDFNASRAKVHAAGLDLEISRDAYAGIEGTWRDVTVPTIARTLDEVSLDKRDETYARAYLNWTPHPSWAGSVEYRYQQIHLKDFIPTDAPERLSTHFVPLTLRYFHPSGLFANLGATYVDQGIRSQFDGKSDKSDFVVFDTAVGYRLPKRRGFLSLEVNNIADKNFSYQDDTYIDSERNSQNFGFLPERTMLGRVTLWF